MWLDEDRAWAIALMRVQADEHTCGHPLSETLDPANTYTVDVRGQCAACYVLAAKASDMPDGMLYTVRRKQT